MSYPCGYEYLLGQQQQLHNIQLIYPAAAAGEIKNILIIFSRMQSIYLIVYTSRFTGHLICL